MNQNNGIIIYQTDDGRTKVDVRLENETLWMTQKAIAELYQKSINTINEHIKNIYQEGELDEVTTIRKNRIVQNEGNRSVEREDELKKLNRIVTMYLDYAEDQAERKQVMHMKDWEEKLNIFLQFNGREVLTDAGKISNEIAKELAYKEYEKYHVKRLSEDKEDDFDKFLEVSKLEKKK